MGFLLVRDVQLLLIDECQRQFATIEEKRGF
jgi:hypothetical protein